MDVNQFLPTLPFTDPVLIFFVVLTIILFAPLLLNKLRIPHIIGLILAGLGVLFIGMNMMGDAMVPLRESEAFISLMTRFSNPALGILAGMICG